VISDWYGRDYATIVPKELIIRALECFRDEHPKEYEALCKKVDETESRGDDNAEIRGESRHFVDFQRM
jgi:hypothetical protein